VLSETDQTMKELDREDLKRETISDKIIKELKTTPILYCHRLVCIDLGSNVSLQCKINLNTIREYHYDRLLLMPNHQVRGSVLPSRAQPSLSP
jgi:hypothetical protein